MIEKAHDSIESCEEGGGKRGKEGREEVTRKRKKKRKKEGDSEKRYIGRVLGTRLNC